MFGIALIFIIFLAQHMTFTQFKMTTGFECLSNIGYSLLNLMLMLILIIFIEMKQVILLEQFFLRKTFFLGKHYKFNHFVHYL